MLKRLHYLREELADAGADAGGGASASPESSAAPSEPSGPSRAPDGTFTPNVGDTLHEAIWGKEGLAATEDPVKPAEPGKQADPKKPEAKDENEDLTRPLEGNVTPQTQQRFQRLTGALKEKDAEIGKVREQAAYHERRASEFVAILNDAGVGPDDFGAFVDFRSALRGRNFDQAEAYLKSQLREFAIATGRNLTGDASGVLTEFPDLAEQVQNMQMSEQAALEVARARRVESAVRQRGEAQQRQQQETQNFAQARDKALHEVAAQVAEWKRTDIDFRVKEQRIAAQMRRLQNVHPAQWAAKVREYYELLSEGATMAGAGRASEPPRPLSGGTAPASAAKSATSMHEAMWSS